MTIRVSSSPFLLLYIYNVPSWTTHTIFGRRWFFFSEAPVFTKSALPRKKFQMPGKHAKVKLLLLLLLLQWRVEALASSIFFPTRVLELLEAHAKKVLTRMKQTESPSQALLSQSSNSIWKVFRPTASTILTEVHLQVMAYYSAAYVWLLQRRKHWKKSKVRARPLLGWCPNGALRSGQPMTSATTITTFQEQDCSTVDCVMDPSTFFCLGGR